MDLLNVGRRQMIMNLLHTYLPTLIPRNCSTVWTSEAMPNGEMKAVERRRRAIFRYSAPSKGVKGMYESESMMTMKIPSRTITEILCYTHSQTVGHRNGNLRSCQSRDHSETQKHQRKVRRGGIISILPNWKYTVKWNTYKGMAWRWKLGHSKFTSIQLPQSLALHKPTRVSIASPQHQLLREQTITRNGKKATAM